MKKIYKESGMDIVKNELGTASVVKMSIPK